MTWVDNAPSGNWAGASFFRAPVRHWAQREDGHDEPEAEDDPFRLTVCRQRGKPAKPRAGGALW